MTGQGEDDQDMTAPAPAGPRPIQQISVRVDYDLAEAFRAAAGGGRYGQLRSALEDAMRDWIQKKTGHRPD